jgi:hypothetical protein
VEAKGLWDCDSVWNALRGEMDETDNYRPKNRTTHKRRESMTRISQKLLLVMTLLLAVSVGHPARAAADNQGASQQDKIKACNNIADNKGLKGDDRKNFMQDCLNKAGNQQANEMSQKDKMNVCKNLADRKSLTGSDRKSFLKDCMNKANPK